MASTQATTAVRKRQQIANANKMMFLWVAGVSVLLGIALVASIFLFQKALFNEKVLAAKDKTASTLTANNEAVEPLQKNVQILNTNDDLRSVMIPGQDDPVQVVLDALPSEVNSSALGASLQKKFLSMNGIQLESLVVNDPAGTGDDGIVSTTSDDTVAPANAISFSFTISSASNDPDSLKRTLVDIEKSIRPIDITSVSVEAQGARLNLKAQGVSYFEPPKTGQTTKELIRP